MHFTHETSPLKVPANSTASFFMAQLEDRSEGNIPGRYYVDSSCTDCDYCRYQAPQFFRRDDDQGLTIVYAQPVTVDEIRLCEEAVQGCPTESIGNDGE